MASAPATDGPETSATASTTTTPTTPTTPTTAPPSRPPLWRTIVAHPLLQAALVVVGFFGVRVVLTQWPAKLPVGCYTSAVIVAQALMVPAVFFALLFAVGVGGLLKFRGLSWRDEDLRPLRVVVVVIVVVLAWAYALYPYNHFLGRAHLVDRFLIVALAALVVRHPAFFPSFVWVVVVVIGQFKAPIGYSWTDIDLVIDASSVLVSALVLRSLGLARAQAVIIALLVLVGAQCFDAAILKHARSPTGFEWPTQNNIANLFVSSHINGWLPDLSEPTMLSLASFVSSVAVPLQSLTFVLEAAPLIMLLSRRLTIAVLLGLVGMHLGILVASGIFFWKWSALCLALAWTLHRSGKSWLHPRWMALVAAPYIFFGGSAADVGNGLAWWDTRVSQRHHFVAVTTTGERFQIDEHDLAPYDKSMAQDRFFYLHNEKQLTGTLGSAQGGGYRQFRAIQEATTKEQIVKMIAKRGVAKGDPAKAARFDRFVREFVRSRNAHGDDALVRFFAVVSPPMHIGHRAPRAARLPLDAKVDRVEVMLREVWYDGAAVHQLRELKVRDIQIPGPKDDDPPAPRAAKKKKRAKTKAAAP